MYAIFRPVLLLIACCIFLGRCDDDDFEFSLNSRQIRRSGCLSSRGQFPHERYCDQFYSCWDDVVTVETCPQGLMFSPLTGSCDYKDRVDCSRRTRVFRPRNWPGDCVTDWGTYRVADNCSLFYACYAGIPFEMQCGEGTVFNQDREICDWDYNVPECFQGFNDFIFPPQGFFSNPFFQRGQTSFTSNKLSRRLAGNSKSTEAPVDNFLENSSPLKPLDPQVTLTTKQIPESETLFTQASTRLHSATVGSTIQPDDSTRQRIAATTTSQRMAATKTQQPTLPFIIHMFPETEGTSPTPAAQEDAKTTATTINEATSAPLTAQEDAKTTTTTNNEATSAPPTAQEDAKITTTINNEATSAPPTAQEDAKITTTTNNEATSAPPTAQEDTKITTTTNNEATSAPPTAPEETNTATATINNVVTFTTTFARSDRPRMDSVTTVGTPPGKATGTTRPSTVSDDANVIGREVSFITETDGISTTETSTLMSTMETSTIASTILDTETPAEQEEDFTTPAQR